MPLYDYMCYQCGEEEEYLDQREGMVRSCKECGARLVRKFPAVNVVYRGVGFFTTDNRKIRGRNENNLPVVW